MNEPTDRMRELTQHLTGAEAKIYRLNMTKLNDQLPNMLLTVEERFMLEELVTVFFGHKPPPQLPWVTKAHAAAERHMLRSQRRKAIKEEKKP
jgi:hypothetical protein